MPPPGSGKWKRRKRRREVARQAVLHVALLVGAVIFSFPFFWLVTTTFKADSEIFVFPPNWIPDTPYYSDQSPFVSATEYPPMRRPGALSRPRWAALEPRLTAVLLAAGREDLRGMSAGPSLDDPTSREQLVRGLWAELAPAIPDELIRGSTRALLAYVPRQVTPDLVRKVWARFDKQLLLGELHILDRDNNELIASPSDVGVDAWPRADFSGCELRGVREVGGESGVLVAYTARGRERGPRLTRTAALKAPASRIDRISLSLRDDESWRHLVLVIRTREGAFEGDRPFIMGNGQWQDVTWTFTKPFDPTSRDILLHPLRHAESSPEAAPPGEDAVTLQLSIIPRSRLDTIYDKYIRNYREAMRYVPFWTYVRNSFYLTGMNIIGQLFACSLVAYAFSRLRWFGRDVFFVILLSTMMLPPQVTMVPVFLIFKTLGWYNTLRPLWVPSLFGAAFFIFLLRQFFMTIPRDLEDAAKIDGCGPFGIYWRIMLPLVKPALATVAIFQFLGTWNDFMGPLIYIGDERLTPLSLGLFNFRMEHGAEWGMLMAASLLMTLPAVIIFFFAQRYFIQGITLTGVKG